RHVIDCGPLRVRMTHEMSAESPEAVVRGQQRIDPWAGCIGAITLDAEHRSATLQRLREAAEDGLLPAFHINLDQCASVETERVQAADRCRDHVSVVTDDPRVAAYATEVQLTAGGHTPDVDEFAGTVVIRDDRPMRLDLLQPMRRDVPL